jgi:hypothetical protein
LKRLKPYRPDRKDTKYPLFVIAQVSGYADFVFELIYHKKQEYLLYLIPGSTGKRYMGKLDFIYSGRRGKNIKTNAEENSGYKKFIGIDTGKNKRE